MIRLAMGCPMRPIPMNPMVSTWALLLPPRSGAWLYYGSGQAVDHPADGAAERAVGHDRRVLARPAGHDNEDVLGGGHHREQRGVVGDLLHPQRPVVDAPHAAEPEPRERQPRVLEDEAL